MITVELIFDDSVLNVTTGPISMTNVTIVDADCKFSLARQALFVLVCDMICISLGHSVLTVSFTNSRIKVNESTGMVEICVEKDLATAADVTLYIESSDGNATGNGSDYTLADSIITIPKLENEKCLIVEIKDDEQFEDVENFLVNLSYPGTRNVQITVSTVEVIILGKCHWEPTSPTE